MEWKFICIDFRAGGGGVFLNTLVNQKEQFFGSNV